MTAAMVNEGGKVVLTMTSAELMEIVKSEIGQKGRPSLKTMGKRVMEKVDFGKTIRDFEVEKLMDSGVEEFEATQIYEYTVSRKLIEVGKLHCITHRTDSDEIVSKVIKVLEILQTEK